MGTYVGARNTLSLVVVLLVAAAFVLLGARMVWKSQQVVVARSDIYREMVEQRRLNTRRDQLMNSVAGLKATTRMESRARMLGLQPPGEKNEIVVKPENK